MKVLYYKNQHPNFASQFFFLQKAPIQTNMALVNMDIVAFSWDTKHMDEVIACYLKQEHMDIAFLWDKKTWPIFFGTTLFSE
jgi:hypothetical protein